MESRRLRAAVVLLLAIAALGVAGAAVDTSGSGTGSSGMGEGSSSGVGPGEKEGAAERMQDLGALFPGDVLTSIIGALALAGFAVAVVTGVTILLRWDWDDLIAFVRSKGGIVVAALLGVVGLYLFLQAFQFSSGGDSPSGGGGGSGGLRDTASETGLQLTPAVAFAVIVVVVVLLVLLARNSEDDDTIPSTDPDPDGGPVESSGSAGGGTDIGRPPADNEVYRAWLSLADAADANARRATPEQVADRAVDAGVDETAAREITALFESVRYGGAEPTGGIEERAKRARSELGGEP